VLCLKESIDNNKKSESRSDFKQNKVKKRQNEKNKKKYFVVKEMKKVREVFEKISEHKFRMLCEVQNLKGEISKLRFF